MSTEKIIIYSKTNCPYCDSAKQFFKRMNKEYEEVDLTNNAELRSELSAKHNWRTVPIILIDGRFIGGFQDMMTLHNDGNLFIA